MRAVANACTLGLDAMGWLDVEDPTDDVIFAALVREAQEIAEKRMSDAVARGIARAFRKG